MVRDLELPDEERGHISAAISSLVERARRRKTRHTSSNGTMSVAQVRMFGFWGSSSHDVVFSQLHILLFRIIAHRFTVMGFARATSWPLRGFVNSRRMTRIPLQANRGWRPNRALPGTSIEGARYRHDATSFVPTCYLYRSVLRVSIAEYRAPMRLSRSTGSSHLHLLKLGDHRDRLVLHLSDPEGTW